MKETLRLLRVFAWLRWRLTVNGLKRGRKRGAMEAVSAVASIAVPVLLGVLLIPILLGIGVASAVGGWGFAARGGSWRILVGAGLRLHVGIMMIALLIGPIARSAKSGAVDYSRHALLPVPRRLLHALEIASAMADPWLLAATPPLVLLPLGFLAGGGGVAGGCLALVAGIVMALFLTCFAGLVHFLFHLLFRSRRRGETVFLVFMMLASSMGMFSWAFQDIAPKEMAARAGREAKKPRGSPPGPTGQSGSAGITTDMTPRGWTRVIPSELYAATALNAMSGKIPEAAATGGMLAGEAFLCYLASLWAWRRLLETPATGSSRRGSNRFRGLPDFSFLPGGPPVSAVAAGAVRSILRTVTGKMAVFFSPIFSLLFGVVFFHSREVPPGVVPLSGGILIAIVGVLSVLSLQPILLNQFAADGAGLALQFLSPLGDKQLVRGKVLGAGLLVAFATLLGSVPAVFIAPGTALLLYPVAFFVVMSTYALAGPAGAVISALLPVKMDLGKIGRAARPHQGATLLFFLVLGLCVGPGIGLTALGVFVIGSPLAALGLTAAWLAIAVGIGSLLLTLAAEMVGHRRENLGLVATGR